MRIKGSRINFDTYSIYKHPQGIYIDGKFIAKQLDAQSHAQGASKGYASGKFSPGAGAVSIEYFPFASDAGGEDYGELATIRNTAAGQSSETHGYTSGGYVSPLTNFNVIDRFSFASSSGSASDVGDLTAARFGVAGQSSTTAGYTSGGRSVGPSGVPGFNVIDKFPFSVVVNAVDVGDISETRRSVTGQSSSTHGYTSGGTTPTPTSSNTIDKFPFASDSNATDVGDLTQARSTAAGQSSGFSGYTSGGVTPSVWVTTIDKFSFASDIAATTVGALTQARGGSAGQSSTTHGYTTGGRGPVPIGSVNTIDKFPFSADIDATAVGNLDDSKQDLAGQQV